MWTEKLYIQVFSICVENLELISAGKSLTSTLKKIFYTQRLTKRINSKEITSHTLKSANNSRTFNRCTVDFCGTK